MVDRRRAVAKGTPNPFVEFVKPGRRRTDHPWVVGTVVLCLGLTTVGSILQLAALIWLGFQVSGGLEREALRDLETASMRKTIIESGAASSNILRRVCLNVAKTEKDQQECLALVPPITPHDKEAR